jgi:large subunit ribosomal protein L19e
MKLNKKKELAAKALKVGKDRISFVSARLEDIKESITKQDIKDLKEEGAIIVKEVKGRKKKINTKRKRRSVGNIRKKVNTRKKDYVIMTRKLRAQVKELKDQGKLSREEVKEIRKKIRNREFKSKAHMKQLIGGIKK